jgi:NAD(P)H-nitrite reductase large subunit
MNNIVIIGNSAAGIAAAESIRYSDKESKVSIISDEDYTAYCRCVLSYYLAGEKEESHLVYRASEFYKENNIDLILNTKVIRTEPKKNRIVLENGEKLGYDKLIIATGSLPKFPEIKGIHKRGVFGFRTIKDAREISGLLTIAKTAVCLGGGLIGLKAAYALKKRGLEVKVIVKSDQILSQVLDRTAADIVKRHLEFFGIEILTGLDVKEFLGEGELKAVKLDSGKIIGCEVAIIGKGVSANTAIVKDTDIKIQEGIMVNEYLRTSVENVFAAGDCAETFDLILEEPQINALWPNAVEQGALAGRNVSGENIIYPGSIGMNSAEFFGLPVVSMGVVRQEQGMEVLLKSKSDGRIYKKIVLKDNRVKGVILLGDIENSGVYLNLMKEKIDVSSLKETLLDDSFNYANIIELPLSHKEKIYICSGGIESGGDKCLS